MGRLDDSRVPDLTNSFDGPPLQKFVARVYWASVTRANVISTVEQKGMGHDIWTVEFDDITEMLRVCTSKKHPFVGTSTDFGI
jgi:hypothetical protein